MVMEANPQQKAKVFLEGLHSDTTKNTFDHLMGLVESLENKDDPDPIEIKLVDSIYSFIEQLNLLEGNIKKYSTENVQSVGSKLSSLYEDISYNGHIYRD